jgi:hypothetical protein
MDQADSVHSTPPTNTSANTTEKPQDSRYLPTDISPEEVFQAIGRLRKEARDEIDKLIRFLDDSDNHMELEEAVDDVPCDDSELEAGDGDDEPSLCGVSADIGRGPSCISGEDLEGDDTPNGESAEDEPSLGSSCTGEDATQELWVTGGRSDLEGDEHDGREPEDEQYDGKADDEPSLGWTDEEAARGRTYAGAMGRSCDMEEGGSAASPQNRTKLPKTIDVQDRGYGGRKIIRNLTDGQTKALAGKINRDSGVSLD